MEVILSNEDRLEVGEQVQVNFWIYLERSVDMWLLMSLFWGCSELTEIIPIPDTTARIDAVAEVNQRQSELAMTS